MSVEFGSYVRKHRLQRGLTLHVCAESLDVSTSFLAAVERGKKLAPSWLVADVIGLLKLNKIMGTRLWLEGGCTFVVPVRGTGKAYTDLARAVAPLL